MKKTTEETKEKGYAIFKRILENKKAIEKCIKEGKPLTEIKGLKIAKPL